MTIGKIHRSAIGTLVERSTRYVMSLHLPDGYHPRSGARAPRPDMPVYGWG